MMIPPQRQLRSVYIEALIDLQVHSQIALREEDLPLSRRFEELSAELVHLGSLLRHIKDQVSEAEIAKAASAAARHHDVLLDTHDLSDAQALVSCFRDICAQVATERTT